MRRTSALGRRLIFVQVHHADEGQVAIKLVQVQAIAKNKLVRDLKAAVADRDEGLPPFVLAVNVSAAQFRSPDFEARLLAILDETDVPPDLLELEVTRVC